MKRTVSMLLALTLGLTLVGCSGQRGEKNPDPEVSTPVEESQTTEPRSFTDSLGRTVELPAQIDHIAVSAAMAQRVVAPLAADKMIGRSGEFTEAEREYYTDAYAELPVVGEFYGKETGDLEVLLSSGAQVVIDVGTPKDGLAEDLDALTRQTGIPFVHISFYADAMDEVYIKLGELLNMPDEAEKLAAYCRETYDMVQAIADKAEKANILYVVGDKGLNVIARGSYHAGVIDMLTNNLAVVDNPVSKGFGNEVDMEQILLWDPDIIFFSPESIYDTVADDPLYQQVTAIRNGAYYKVPLGPDNWMGFPPSVQQLLGMQWMAKVLYPDLADYDLYERVNEFYALFYHKPLSREEFDKLVAGSLSPET